MAANAAVALVAVGLLGGLTLGTNGTAARRSRPGGWRYPAAAAVGCGEDHPRRRRPPALGAKGAEKEPAQGVAACTTTACLWCGGELEKAVRGKERPNSSSAPALHRPHPHCASPSRLQSTRIAASPHRTFTGGDCFQDRQPKARDERSGQGRRQALALALTASEAALTLPLLEQSPTPSIRKNTH